MTTTRDVLVRARGLVAGGWERLAFATDAAGHGCNPYSPDAVSFCSLGALLRAGADLGHPMQGEQLDAFTVANGLPRGGTSTWNGRPERTQAEVLAAFDKAIAAQETP